MSKGSLPEMRGDAEGQEAIFHPTGPAAEQGTPAASSRLGWERKRCRLTAGWEMMEKGHLILYVMDKAEIVVPSQWLKMHLNFNVRGA